MSDLKPVDRLIEVFSRLPGVGRRSAERMARRVSRDKGTFIEDFIGALSEVSETICACSRCGNLTEKVHDPCRLCTDPRRNAKLLCVVEDPGDITLIEKSGGFRGRYHALMGKISPMKGEGINNIRMDALIRRVKDEGIEEVILALNSDVESDATASFIHDVLTVQKIRVSRLAFGLPAGSGISYSDPVTLSRAISGRRELG